MNIMPPTPSNQLLPFESQLLAAVEDVVPREWRPLLLQQVSCINHVQRPLDWKEIEFYCKKWFRTRWPEHVLFPERGEVRLAECDCAFGPRTSHITVWAVNGHVFSLESAQGMSGLSISGPLRIVSISRGT
jgi:hypothetical protein